MPLSLDQSSLSFNYRKAEYSTCPELRQCLSVRVTCMEAGRCSGNVSGATNDGAGKRGKKKKTD